MPPAIEHLDELVRVVAEGNPDLPAELIRDILLARQEVAVEEYLFD